MARPSLKRVEEGIYTNSAGNYAIRVSDPLTSKTVQKTLPKGTTKTEARKERRALQDAVRRRKHGPDETCDSFAQRWPTDFREGRGESTALHNAERVRTFAHDFAGRTLRSVSPIEAHAWIVGGTVPDSIADAARNWKGAQEVKRAGRTKISVPGRRSCLLAVRAMFNDAMRVDLADINPFANLRVPRSRGRKDIQVLTRKELDRLVDIARHTHGDYGPVYSAMVQFAAWTGLRPGEIYALEWDDIDFSRDVIQVKRAYQQNTGTVTKPKTPEAIRPVPLLPPAKQALNRVERLNRQIFYTARGGTFTGRVAHYYWNPVRLAFWMGLPEARQREIPRDFDFYELRHFFGSICAEMGMTPYDIASHMGHADGGKLAMERYIHTRGEDAIKRAQEAFSRLAAV